MPGPTGNRAPCRCPAYEFPHRYHGGDCDACWYCYRESDGGKWRLCARCEEDARADIEYDRVRYSGETYP